MNVPLPASGRHFGDVVLHDGHPDGVRLMGGREHPVFNELAVLERSAFQTFQATLLATARPRRAVRRLSRPA
jgi:hypothetical protein